MQVGTKSVGFLKDNFPTVERVEVEKNQEMFHLVEIGRADAAVTGKPAAKVYAQAKRHAAGGRPAAHRRGIRLRAAQGRARAASSSSTTALKKLKADGTYDKLVSKYL